MQIKLRGQKYPGRIHGVALLKGAAATFNVVSQRIELQRTVRQVALAATLSGPKRLDSECHL